MRWYNDKRIKVSVGAMSPMKYRQHLGQIHNQSRKTSASPRRTSQFSYYTATSLNLFHLKYQ
ncbi:IS3 family transposase [Klebsiella pneumoniae]|uniref:IS3 family transposase n=1 Tax=Klebsiella pneumoniae TaxID=573 RepID=UPI003593FFA1